jgi:hypothetical protein
MKSFSLGYWLIGYWLFFKTATGPPYTAQDEFVVNEFDVSPATRFFRIRQVP